MMINKKQQAAPHTGLWWKVLFDPIKMLGGNTRGNRQTWEVSRDVYFSKYHFIWQTPTSVCVLVFFQQTHHTWSAPYGILWSGSQNLRRTSTSTCISQSRRPSTVSHISWIIPHMFFHRNLWPYYAVDNSFTSPQPLHRPKSIDGRDQNPVPGNWAMKNTTFSHLIILAAK